MMGLLSRRRSATAVIDDVWQPLTGEVATIADDGDRGYEVTFYRVSAPGAILAITVYASETLPEGASSLSYQMGYRCDYSHSAAAGSELWTATDFHYGSHWGDPEVCDQAAQMIAEQFATLGTGAPAAHWVPFFGWDGVPW